MENCAVLWKCYDLTHPGLVGKWFKGTLEELQNVFPVMKRHKTSASWRPEKLTLTTDQVHAPTHHICRTVRRMPLGWYPSACLELVGQVLFA